VLRLVEADSIEQLDTIRELFLEYQAELGLDLCFQGFEQELADPLALYGRPPGRLLLAHWDGDLAGCGALKDLGGGIAEIKRIYVRPPYRRHGIARALSEHLMSEAARIGYERVRLDTLARLSGALALYRSMGFMETEPYNYNPEPDIVYMERPVHQTSA
jgi:putative acetyltransferase